jgi:hypothetical protein
MLWKKIVDTKKMSRLIQTLSLVGCALLLTACDGPLPFMAGGKLSGNVVDAPATWQLDEDSGLAQLETHPEDPYSINLTYVQLDGRLYAYAGDTKTNWVKHIEKNPQVRIRVDDTIYRAQAIQVNDKDELAKFAAVWVNLSMVQRDPHSFEEVWLYRLVAR